MILTALKSRWEGLEDMGDRVTRLLAPMMRGPSHLEKKLCLMMACLMILSAGCTTTRVEPALSWPEKPNVKFFECGPENAFYCLTKDDANELDRWFLKLQYFKEARERILK